MSRNISCLHELDISWFLDVWIANDTDYDHLLSHLLLNEAPSNECPCWPREKHHLITDLLGLRKVNDANSFGFLGANKKIDKSPWSTWKVAGNDSSIVSRDFDSPDRQRTLSLKGKVIHKLISTSCQTVAKFNLFLCLCFRKMWRRQSLWSDLLQHSQWDVRMCLQGRIRSTCKWLQLYG